MNREASFLGKHPTREEHERAELHDLEQQFTDLERRLDGNETGRSLHKFLLTTAYDKLTFMKEKGMLTSDQAADFYVRAESMYGQLYEDAA